MGTVRQLPGTTTQSAPTYYLCHAFTAKVCECGRPIAEHSDYAFAADPQRVLCLRCIAYEGVTLTPSRKWREIHGGPPVRRPTWFIDDRRTG